MSAVLGERFPPEYREESFNRQFKPGAVFRLFSEETDPPKIKRFVIIGINQEIKSAAILFINTVSLSNPNLRQFQYPLEIAERPYLDHGSFVDCTHLYERNIDSLKERFIADPSIHLGEMSASDLNIVKSFVKSTKTIPKIVKENYGIL